MTDEFDGLVAAVTGGSSGIGAATADVLADRGAKVAVLDLSPAAGQVEHRLFLEADVTDDESVRGAIAGIVARVGRLDVLINNAGIGARALSRTTTTRSGIASSMSTWWE